MAAPANGDDLAHVRARFWILGVLLVCGSCLLAIVHLSHGLHVQLVANRKIVAVLREQVLAEAEEREMLLRDKDSSSSKTALLRSKAKLVTEELLDQHRKSKHLQNELLLAREDIQALSKNCTIATQRLRHRYDVTLRALHDRVVQEQEFRALLDRNVLERAKIESSLGVMQDRAYNLSVQLKTTKQKLRDVIGLATQQRDEVARLKAQVAAEAAKAAAHHGGDDSAASLNTNGNQGATGIAVDAAAKHSPWTSHVDKASGKTFYFNTITKKSVWERPADI